MNRSKEKARKNAMVIEAIANSHNTDSKTGKQQRILVEFSGHRCGILSLKRTLVDLCGRGKTMGCRRGDSTCGVRRCSRLSIVCWKLPCSVRCVFCFIADVRRRCCTGCCTAFACTAVFEKRKEATIRRSLPNGASGWLCRSL